MPWKSHQVCCCATACAANACTLRHLQAVRLAPAPNPAPASSPRDRAVRLTVILIWAPYHHPWGHAPNMSVPQVMVTALNSSSALAGAPWLGEERSA